MADRQDIIKRANLIYGKALIEEPTYDDLTACIGILLELIDMYKPLIAENDAMKLVGAALIGQGGAPCIRVDEGVKARVEKFMQHVKGYIRNERSHKKIRDRLERELQFMKDPLDTADGAVCEFCKNTGHVEGLVKMGGRGREEFGGRTCLCCNTNQRKVDERNKP